MRLLVCIQYVLLLVALAFSGTLLSAQPDQRDEGFIAFYAVVPYTGPNQANLTVVDAASWETRTVAPGIIIEPSFLSWSPDYSSLAVTTVRPSVAFTVIDVASEQVTVPVETDVQTISGTYSPVGGVILYFKGARHSEDPRSKLFSITADLDESTALTSDQLIVYDAQWSPDGQKIVMVARVRDACAYLARPYWADLYVLNLTSAELHNITLSGAGESMPAWSSDGERLAYVTRYDRDHWAIYTADAGGSNETLIREHTGLLSQPKWLADDTQLIYVLHQEKGEYAQLVLHDLESDESTVPVDTGNIGSIALSPDRTKVAYISMETPRQRPAYMCVYELTDGSQRCTEEEAISVSELVWAW